MCFINLSNTTSISKKTTRKKLFKVERILKCLAKLAKLLFLQQLCGTNLLEVTLATLVLTLQCSLLSGKVSAVLEQFVKTK